MPRVYLCAVCREEIDEETQGFFVLGEHTLKEIRLHTSPKDCLKQYRAEHPNDFD
jgi:hypothetical protein